MAQHEIILYALSTCVHCRHMREFLEQNNIDFECIYVDTLEGEAQKITLGKVREANPRLSFPTMIVGPEHKVVVGFTPEAVKEALGI